MSLKTPLARVAGLGAAKEGVVHWWGQRITAVALIPLTIWFVLSIVTLIGAEIETVRDWIAQPAVAVLLLLLLLSGFYHMKLGVQVVIEDYVHHPALKLVLQLGVTFSTVILAVICIFSVLKISFGV